MSTPSLQLTGTGVRNGVRTAAPGRWVLLAERVAAAVSLVLLLPVLAITLAAIAIASGRCPLIAHRRVGRYGAEFWMLKIRTMWDPSQTGQDRGWIEYITETHVPEDKSAPDPRVTSRLAAFCRRFSLDELPQLVHVATGAMRLTGPRPVTRREWDTYYGPEAVEVLSVPPGITGLWQVLGRNRLTYAQRRRLDLFYVRHQGVMLDLMLLWRTPARVLSGRDAG